MMQKGQWVTIQQVAKRAGVSPMTVSRYLKDKKSVKQKSADSIAIAIQETGYLPNKMAGVLAGGKSQVVGVIMPTLSIATFRRILDNIITVFSDAKIELIVAVTNYDSDREIESINNFLGWRVKGLIFTGIPQSPHLRAMISGGDTPCIYVADTDLPQDFEGIAIGCSHYQGGYELGQYMVQQGCYKCAYASTDMAFWDYRNNNRYQGFVDGVIEHGGFVSDKINIGDKIDVEVGYNSIDIINIRHWDGIMFPSDELAMGAILRLLKQGVKIPQDISICGYHGSLNGRYLPIPLTSYNIPWDSIGGLVLDKFQQIWNGQYTKTTEIIHIPAGIVKGDSC